MERSCDGIIIEVFNPDGTKVSGFRYIIIKNILFHKIKINKLKIKCWWIIKPSIFGWNGRWVSI